MGHDRAISSVLFSPNGKLLASCSYDKTIRLWDPVTGQEIRRMANRSSKTKPKPDDDVVETIAFSPDGRALAAGISGHDYGDGYVQLWDISTGKELRRLSGIGRERIVFCVSFSPDGKIIAAGASDSNQVLVWETETGKMLPHMRGPGCQFVKFGVDGRTLVGSGIGDQRIHVWELATGKELMRSPGHEYRVCTAVFSRDGNALATVGQDHTICLWEASTGRYRLQLNQLPSKLTFSPCYSAWFTPDAKTVVSACGDRTLCFWETDAGKPIHKLRLSGLPEDATIDSFAFSPDARRVVVNFFSYSSGDSPIRLFDASSGKEIWRIQEPSNPEDASKGWGLIDSMFTSRLVLSPDGKFLASAHGGKSIYIYDAGTGKRMRRLRGHELAVAALSFSPDGKLLASCSGDLTQDGHLFDNTMRVWEVSSGRQLMVWKTPGCNRTVVFSPDHRLLASADDYGPARVWETATGKEIARFLDRGNRVRGIAFAPDMKTLASAMADSTALVWDLAPPEWEASPRVARTDKELTRLWSDLAGEDAAKAYRAIWVLSAIPDRAIPLLKDRLHPAAAVTAESISRLVADLDADDFDQREAASRKLAGLGWLAEPALHKALAATTSEEVRSRIKRLLEELKDGRLKDPEIIRSVRAIWVLQRIGSPEAKAILQRLADGAPERRVTQEARAALDFLAKQTARR